MSLNLPDKYRMPVFSCIKFGWHLSDPSLVKIDHTLQPHSSLKGNTCAPSTQNSDLRLRCTQTDENIALYL